MLNFFHKKQLQNIHSHFVKSTFILQRRPIQLFPMIFENQWKAQEINTFQYRKIYLATITVEEKHPARGLLVLLDTIYAENFL